MALKVNPVPFTNVFKNLRKERENLLKRMSKRQPKRSVWSLLLEADAVLPVVKTSPSSNQLGERCRSWSHRNLEPCPTNREDCWWKNWCYFWVQKQQELSPSKDSNHYRMSVFKAGKTTFCGRKLANKLVKEENARPLMIGTISIVQRYDQLEDFVSKINVPVFFTAPEVPAVDRSSRFGVREPNPRAGKSWSIQPVVCKLMVKPTWVAWCQSPCWAKWNLWLSMLWLVAAATWRSLTNNLKYRGHLNQDRWYRWCGPFLFVRLLGSQSSSLVQKNHWLSKPSTQTVCLAGSSVWGICWHWLSAFKNMIETLPLNLRWENAGKYLYFNDYLIN